MKLRVNYIIEDDKDKITRIAEIDNVRIKTKEDQKRIERIIEKKLGYKKVSVFNWKIIGTVSDKIGKE